MAQTPFLIDFDALDLSEPVAGRQDVERYLPQRGRFSMLDGILHEDAERKLVVGFKEIREDDWWAPDHIPGRPLFPGALMIETAAQLSAYDYMKFRCDLPEGSFVGFGGLEGARFRAPVVPPCRFLVATFASRPRRTMFRYEAQGFVGRQLVFEGLVIGVVV